MSAKSRLAGLRVFGWLRKLYRWWIREDLRVREWERHTGLRWLREGPVKKGGLNGPPRLSRPHLERL